ncbi:uncharacterized protein FYW23_009329 [Sylvia borin]
MASTPRGASPGQGGALDLTTGVLGPPGRGRSPQHSHIPLSPSATPGQPPVPLAPGSTAVAQSGVTHTSPGSSHTPLSPQSAPASGSSVTPLSTPLPSSGTGWGVLGFGPTLGIPMGDPSPGLPHSGSRVGPAESPPSLGGTQVGVGSLAPPSAPGPPQQPALSQPASSLGPTPAIGVTATSVTATITTATITTATSPERLGDMGTITAEPRAAVLQRDVVGLTWGSPAQVPTVMPRLPQQPTDSHGGGPGSPSVAVDTDLAQPSSSPRGTTDSDTPQVTPAGVGRAPQVFIVEDQPPLLRASLLRVPCELVLDMAFVPALRDPGSPERQELLQSFNRTVSAGWGGGCAPGTWRSAPATCAGHSPLHPCAWLPAAGGDGHQGGQRGDVLRRAVRRGAAAGAGAGPAPRGRAGLGPCPAGAGGGHGPRPPPRGSG